MAQTNVFDRLAKALFSALFGEYFKTLEYTYVTDNF